MTALELIEELAINPNFKKELFENGQHPLALKANKEIEELRNKKGKFWCALMPAKDDEQEEQESEDQEDVPKES
ncbi:hypothetical protein AB6T38_04635 [Aliiglaciecola sp. SL4]|uniref:hypothetical protein n=1 Tax=Aliiglaciecola sp. SL4 TaxID=3239806 RepID=UPI00355B036E